MKLHALLGTLVLTFGSVAGGHAVVRTEFGAAEAGMNVTDIFRLSVPNESAATSATTQVRMLVPEGFTVVRTVPLAGWTRTFEQDASGRITAVVWKGRVESREIIRLYFQGTTPKTAGKLV